MGDVVGSAEALAENMHRAPYLVIPCVEGRMPPMEGAIVHLVQAEPVRLRPAGLLELHARRRAPRGWLVAARSWLLRWMAVPSSDSYEGESGLSP